MIVGAKRVADARQQHILGMAESTASAAVLQKVTNTLFPTQIINHKSGSTAMRRRHCI